MPDENGNPTMEELQTQLQQLQQANAQANLTIWRQKAIDEHPALRAFSDLIQGDTEEAVLASAKGLAERFGQAFPAPPPAPEQTTAPEPSAQQLYGQPGAGGSGVPVQRPDPIMDLENRVRSNMPNGMDPVTGANRGRGQAKVSKRDSELAVQLAASRHLRDALISHGKLRPAKGEAWRHTESGQISVG